MTVTKLIFLKSGSAWIVPADWQDFNNSVECISAGGGAVNAPAGSGRGGGQGGAYARKSDVALLPGASIAFRVGPPGMHGDVASAGGDTWFNGTSISDCVVGAKGGAASSGSSGATSDQVSASIGDVKYNGGGGGNAGGAGGRAGGGGGGAAGPHGAGANGVVGVGGTGDAGFGGNPSPSSVFVGDGFPVPAGNGREWVQTIDSSEAGSGAGGHSGTAPYSFSGGLYGGGGGGALAEFTSGDGGPGIIVITYEPRQLADSIIKGRS
jgi:hypothetical protein